MRGQASLEYLTTYGWAFLTIMVTLASLSYFGVLSPTKWLPERCNLGRQIVCADWQVDSNTNRIHLVVRNDFGEDIEILDAHVRNPRDGAVGVMSINDSLLDAGETAELNLSGLGSYIFTNSRQSYVIRVQFQKQGTSSPHWITGNLYAQTS